MPAPTSLSTVAPVSPKGGSGYLKAKIGGLDCFVLVDTGASRSIIPKQLWLSVNKGGSDLVNYIGRATAANGGGMHILGSWQTVCQFDSLALVADFLVSDIPSNEVLLGFDFLAKYGAIVDLGNKECRIMGKLLPLVDLEPSIEPQIVVVHTDTLVPPRSEAIVWGQVQSGWGDYAEGMLEPSSSIAKQSDILVARVVCSVQHGKLPVRVINVTNDSLPLKRGMKVGTLFTDIDVGEETTVQGGEGETLLPPWTAETLMRQFDVGEKGFAPDEVTAIKQSLNKYRDVFSRGETDLGRTHLTSHKIDTGDAQPIKMHPRRVPLHLQQEVTNNLTQMLANGIISPSCSPWAAPVVLVKKKGGGLRFCVDYRKLNEVTRKDAYPLPRIDDALDSLSHARWFSTLDLASGYWQVEVESEDRHKTAFATRQGLFEFNVLGFGLCNAPSTFQRLMDLILADLQWTTCLVYLDDIIVFGRTFQEHLTRLDDVLGKLQQANLKVKPSKCNLFATQVNYLGHVISAKGVRPDPAKVEAVREWPVPTNQTEVSSFVGLASYYRRFVKDFADIARPLHKLTEQGKRFQWSEACQCAFDQLKTRLITAPVLAYPDPCKPFILDTDASDVGIGAVISQEEGGMERVIAYASRALTKAERKYATTKKELLAMVVYTKHFRHYLLGKEFVLRTDHNSLWWLHNFQALEGQLARWIEQLANFQYTIIHRPGKLHSNADALSRLPGFHGKQQQAVQDPPAPSGSLQGALVKSNPKVRVVQEAPDATVASELDELSQAQRADSELQRIINCKSLSADSIIPDDPDLQKYDQIWSQLKVQGGRLVRIPPANSDAAAKVQVVLPQSMVFKVLEQLHNVSTGGHLGVQKLQGKVKDRFFWLGWFGDVKTWVKECVDCASRKTQGKRPRAPLQPSVSSRPFERVALDILGPLPETPGKNKYIMVVGDYFSKWTEAFPLPNQEACTVAKVLAEEWVCRFGAPRSLHSDQGRTFESNLFKELCSLLHMHKTRTTPYHPESDGLIERFNRTLLDMLALFIEDNQSNWDRLLPYVMLAYRSSVHASTLFTPYRVLFGQEIVLPVDVMLNIDNRESFTSVSEYVSRLRETLSTVVEAVKKHQARASGHQKVAYDFKAKFQYYSEGELVWLHNKAKKRGVCPKLQRRYKGPFRVVDRVTDVLYRLVPVEGGPDTVVHFNRLKPFASSLPVPSEAVETRSGREQTDCPGEPELHKPPGVPLESSWVQLRPPSRGVPAGVRTTPARQTGSQSTIPSSQQGGPSAGVAVEVAPLSDVAGLGQSGHQASPAPARQPSSPESQEVDMPVGSSDAVLVQPLDLSVSQPGGRGRGTPTVPALRRGRPERQRKAPVWLSDYDVSTGLGDESSFSRGGEV